MANAPVNEPIRLNRFLAALGLGSRRACDELIAEGRVRINGHKIQNPGVRVVPGEDDVAVDKVSLEHPARPLVLLLNKPSGVVSTVSDPQGRPTVIDLCRKYARSRRLFPVGRLDINSTGALLLTNDGMLCYRLTHPSFEVPKTYHVHVRGRVDDKKISRMIRAATPRDGVPPRVELTKRLGPEAILKITLREGRNRQVRKMCEAVGLRVTKLRRIKFGPITVRKLPLGAVRPLDKKELDALGRVANRGKRDGHRQTGKRIPGKG